MQKMKKIVRRFKKEFDIKGIPKLEDLKRAISELGYIPLPYEGNEDIYFKMLNGRIIEKKDGITMLKGTDRYVFYRSTVLKCDMPHILAHEIGHIYLNHLNRHGSYYDTSIRKEAEANAFSLFLIPSYLEV